LALEFLAQRWVSRHDSVPRASAAQLLRAWASEVLIAPRLFCWLQPFAHRRFADQDGLQHRGRRGVVLVHGYLCNRGTWNAWMARCQREGHPFIAVSLEPIFGRIEDYGPTIEAAVARMSQATGLAPLLVGHSMGGIAARAWLSQAGPSARVHRLVTLGSPHRGTWTARFGHSPNARQLRIASPWLQALNRTGAEDRRRFVCFHSNADNMVFPPSHAALEGADNRLLEGLAHVQMVFRPELMEAVLALLEQPPIPVVDAQAAASVAALQQNKA
jgi:triacylglycerol esterase/lipase EstA (alpha/beta hydrolase family)